MRNKVGLALALMALSDSCMAAFVKIDEGATGNTYVDPATIRKEGKRAKVWVMRDYKSSQKYYAVGFSYSYLSSKTRFEFDCKEDKTRALTSYDYRGNLGNGGIANTFEFEKSLSAEGMEFSWTSVVPDTPLGFILEYVCGRVK